MLILPSKRGDITGNFNRCFSLVSNLNQTWPEREIFLLELSWSKKLSGSRKSLPACARSSVNASIFKFKCSIVTTQREKKNYCGGKSLR